MPIVRTLSVPERDLLLRLQPFPEGMRGVLWDLRGLPEGADLGEIDAVVLPNANPSAVLGSLVRAPALKLVQTQTTGYDGVIEAAGSAGVATAAGLHADSTAEHAIGLILAKIRGIDESSRDQIEGRWRPRQQQSLADRRVLLVGAGGIGRQIARRLENFEVSLTRVGRTARVDGHGTVHGADELIRLAGTHDVLVVATPLTEQTRHLISQEVMAALPDGSLIVNVGRGAVVDSAALTRELVAGRLHCALDVFDPEPLPAGHPLWTSPNALITPHLGGNTTASTSRLIDFLRFQIKALASGQPPRNLVQPGPFEPLLSQPATASSE